MFTALKFLAWVLIATFAVSILPVVNSFPVPIETIFDLILPFVRSLFLYVPLVVTILECLALWITYQVGYFVFKLVISFFREGT